MKQILVIGYYHHNQTILIYGGDMDTYQYEKEKSRIFTEEGQVRFLKVRDRVSYLIKIAGAFTTAKAIEEMTSIDNYFMFACIDRLVELGEIKEVASTQQFYYRVFTDNEYHGR